MTMTSRFARLATAFASALLLLVSLAATPEFSARGGGDGYLFRPSVATPTVVKGGDQSAAAVARAKPARAFATGGGDLGGLVPGEAVARRPLSSPPVPPRAATQRLSIAFTAFRARAPPSSAPAA